MKAKASKNSKSTGGDLSMWENLKTKSSKLIRNLDQKINQPMEIETMKNYETKDRFEIDGREFDQCSNNASSNDDQINSFQETNQSIIGSMNSINKSSLKMI